MELVREKRLFHLSYMYQILLLFFSAIFVLCFLLMNVVVEFHIGIVYVFVAAIFLNPKLIPIEFTTEWIKFSLIHHLNHFHSKNQSCLYNSNVLLSLLINVNLCGSVMHDIILSCDKFNISFIYNNLFFFFLLFSSNFFFAC